MIIDGHADVANMKAVILHDFHSHTKRKQEGSKEFKFQ